MNSKAAFRSLLGAVCALLSAQAHAAEFDTPIAIVNGTVIPRPGTVLEGATVLIEDGRIREIGRDVSVPAYAEIIDAKGLWVYPGFIDAASHLGIPEGKPSDEELARLKDLERDPGEAPRTAMQHANRKGIWPNRTVGGIYVADDKKTEALRKAGFTTALVTPRPAILGGSGDLVALSGRPLRSAVVSSGLTQIVSFAEDLNPTFADFGVYPGSRLGVVALLRQTYMDAQWYRQREAQYAAHPLEVSRPPFDAALEAMGPLLDRQQTWIFLANTPDEIHHALDLAEEFNQKIVLLGAKEAWRVAARMAENEVSVIASLDWKEKPRFAPKEKKDKDTPLLTTASWSADWEDETFEPIALRKERMREWDEQVNNLRVLLEAGVHVAITGRDAKEPGDVLKNLRTAIKNGLTADQALAALTTAPAAILGATGQLGTIEPGKLANVTLMTKPLEDKDAQVRDVIVDGHRFEYAAALKAEKKEGDKDEKKDETGADADESKDADSEKSEDDSKEDDDEKKEEEPKEDKYPYAFETMADRLRAGVTGGNVLLRGANVITVTGPVMNGADILVENGRIKSVGAGLTAPEGTKVLDLAGYWVMPGIIDAHSHMATSAINEGSQSITCEVRIADTIDETDLSIHRALAGGVTTIHTMHGSANSIGGQNAVMKLRYYSSPAEMRVTSGPRLVKFALGENVTRTRTIPRFPNSRMGVESVIRQAFNDALEYRREWRHYADETAAGRVAELPRRDLRLEALSDILNGDIWVHSHCYRADEILRLLAVAQDYGIRIATLQHVLEGYRVAPEMVNHGAAGSTFADWWGYKKEAYDAIPYNAAMMMRAGIVTSINSDSEDFVRYLNLEAAKSIRFGGLTADETIRMVTINPATQIGLDGRIGSIEAGKDADFAVYTRHPLDTFAKNVLTLIEGEVYFVHPALDLDNIQPGPASDFVPAPPAFLVSIPESPSRSYAIANATLHPVSSDPIPNGVVVFENGTIVSVGADVTPPAGATVIDAANLHVYPGLINAVSQVGLVEIETTDVTTDNTDIATFQPELRTMSAVNPFSNHVGVTLCEGITTVGVFPGATARGSETPGGSPISSGSVVAGRAGLIQLKGWSMPEMLRDDELGLAVTLPSLPAGYEDDKRGERIDELRKAIETIEDFFRTAKRYADAMLAEADVVHDVRLAAMVPYVRGEKPVFFYASAYKQILEAVRFSETFALKPIIVGGGDAWKCAAMLAEKKIPVIYTDVFRYPTSPYELFDGYYSGPAKLEQAGVQFCIATDTIEAVRRLRLHAGMAVAHGLSEDRAVRSITLDAAQLLGVADKVGSIEAGKVADLIITTGHPCQASTRTVGMFINGDPVELTSLHEESYAKWSNRPAPPLEPAGSLRGPRPMRLGTR